MAFIEGLDYHSLGMTQEDFERCASAVVVRLTRERLTVQTCTHVRDVVSDRPLIATVMNGGAAFLICIYFISHASAISLSAFFVQASQAAAAAHRIPALPRAALRLLAAAQAGRILSGNFIAHKVGTRTIVPFLHDLCSGSCKFSLMQ